MGGVGEFRGRGRGNRKQVYYRDFKSLQEIDVELFTSYLFEAVIVDEKLEIRNEK